MKTYHEKYSLIKEDKDSSFFAQLFGSSNSGGTIKSWLPFSSFFSSLSSGDDTKKLSPKEKNAMDWAKKFQDQTKKEIDNEIKHEEELEKELQDLENQAELNALKQAEAERERVRKQEIAAVRAANAYRKDQERMINAYMKNPERWDANELQTELNKLDDLVNSNLTTEQKASMIDIQSAVHTMCFDDNGNLRTGEELQTAINNFRDDYPELAKRIENSKEFREVEEFRRKELDSKTLKDFIASKTDPSYSTKKAYLDVINETKRQLEEKNTEVNQIDEKIQNNNKEIQKNKEKLEKFNKTLNDFQNYGGEDFIKIQDDGTPVIKGETDDDKKANTKAFAQKRVSQLQNRLGTLTTDEKDKKEADKILAELKELTGVESLGTGNNNDGTLRLTSDSGDVDNLEVNEEKLPASLNTCLTEYGNAHKEHKQLEEKNAELQNANTELDREKTTKQNEMKEIATSHNNVITNALPEDSPISKALKIDEEKPMESCNERANKLNENIKQTEKQTQNVVTSAKKAKQDLKNLNRDKEFKDILGQSVDDYKKSLKTEDLFSDIYPENEDGDGKDTSKIKIGDTTYDVNSLDIKKIGNEEEDKKASQNATLKNIAILSTPIPPEPSKPGDGASDEDKQKYVQDVLKREQMMKMQSIAKDELKSSLKSLGHEGSVDDILKNIEKGNDDDIAKVMDEITDETENDEETRDIEGEGEEAAADDDDKKQEKQLEKAKNGEINPAKIFKRRKRKDGKGTTKSYYHVKNKKYSLSPDDYKEAVRLYREKKQQGSTTQNSSLHITSLKNYILEQLNR